ncbi:acyl-CoA/acyl-ACP dehydrogenase [Staphylococcus chromogenes]|uniref:acyl-CoA dehydrogenase family protein n=1 Tax=Staphylococcus chromogenes TaxID=46126 RepID=UPI000CD1B87C|nr:acyl-CoA dehydrogenase family protein [Staphylococcus chromogenes]MBP0046053.1 acyl-CoA/acyl-ACP dehydrogenase [Staphylococcus chromogenes]PNY96300.1 acyl-CoA dehydrogenase [Staphylococcus chromogenes]GGI32128.1 butyryl-CoA dehydrogenase [Staphylococcus chromogenes]SUM12174.1 acyl-CoA dehydrogenase [Staphylococcus chromogenes]
MQSVLIQSEIQKKWIDKLESQRATFESFAHDNDQNASFPHQNIQWLIDEGYTQLTLPKAYGGYGATIEDMVILQTLLGSMDGATALSIGWHMGLIGELFEKQDWDEKLLNQLAEEVKKGALINRAVSEAETGSPTRGGRPATYAERQGEYYVLNGVKTFTSMSPALTHILVAAYIPEKETVGFFLVKTPTEGLTIADNWDMVGMRATESHDLILKDVKVPLEHLVELKGQGPKFQNGWLLHIPSAYLGIAQAARDYAFQFATTHQPNSIEAPIGELPVVQQNLGKMETKLLAARHMLWSTAHAYQSDLSMQSISNETNASKIIVMNEGLDVVDLAMRVVGAKSLEMSRPLQRYYRDMRAGLHNPPMEDMAYSQIAQMALKAVPTHDNK